MVIQIYDFLKKQLINTLQLDGTASKDLFSAVERIEALQETQDILNVGRIGKTSFGISRLFTKGNMITNLDSESTNVITGRHSFEMLAAPRVEDTTPPNVMIDGVDVGIKVGLIMYDPGWVLKSGKTIYNVFGKSSDGYLKFIGKANLVCAGISSARKFKTLKVLTEFVLKHRRVLEYMASEKGYNWSFEPSCDLFLQDFEASLSERNYQKYMDQKDYLQDLLDDINTLQDIHNPDADNIPAEATDENIHDEILYRMTKFNFFECGVLAFKRSGTIYSSEFGGMLYHLDDGAAEAVKQAEEAGLVPWHVINNTYNEIGTVYTVLYVSRDTSDWASERGDKNGVLTAFCWNQDQSFGEFGSVQVSPANGGLVRVA